ncbi:MAG: zinc-binding dehydrogenase [Alphaproteobacteria bacterium]|nr:zinc-binding dehydrogenase [Alphaproteobacteria bacterium]MBU0804542.1 zinc-binding dehydrogenase [Alphaproteobacteria bacterium]MBU0872090.1 zinc-binding dehydrogenase [Alphaproteobacteria bacterium]MBU1403182.1 zinc-binding dehydrogenase [Alphaproteobacteria bacterium]MBU1592966.1 zinc-binding dehydrogenase [Alphaproteobacteria bacterium]
MTLPDDMQALVLNNDGFALKKSGSVLESLDPYVTLTRVGVPKPGPSQVLVKVSLASINPSDVMFIKGQYGQPRAKGQPAGFEGVGTVVAAGEAAAPLAGMRIAFATGQSGWGSWADYAIAEAGACIPLIDGVRDEDGAALIVNPLTAIAMFGIVREAGEKAFVMTAGASQLSKLILELAKEAGYRPIVTVRRDDQIEALKAAGAVHVLNATADDFHEKLREVMKAEKPRIFLDAVTGSLASQIFAAMPRGGRWIIYGRMDLGDTLIPEPGQLIFMNKRIEGFWLTEWMRQAGERRKEAVIDAQTRFADGRWATDVTAIVPLSEAVARVPDELAKPNGKVFIKP